MTRTALTPTAIALLMIATLPGCGVEMSELTPGQARAQVIAAAREIVAVTRVPVREAWFWRGSCTDGGGPPFRGHLRIAYDRADSYQTSETEIAGMIDRLRAAGWDANPGFRSHSEVLRKGDVHAVFRAQHAGIRTRGIEVIGPCADATTGGAGSRRTEPVDLGRTPG